MATAEQRAAAREASLVYQAALVAFGIQTVAESYDAWEDVQPVPRTVQSSGVRWLGRVLEVATGRSRAAQVLAMAYYRYHRALLTGSTLVQRGGDGEPFRSLSTLRDEFYDMVEALVPDILTDDRRLVNDDGEVVTERPPTNDETILLDDDVDLDAILKEISDRVEEEAEAQLLSTGLLNLEALIREVDDSLPAAEVDQIREEAHAQAGARQSAAAERVALAGARDTVSAVTNADPKVIGYVRVSSTGTPCGWCAMLISRGAVYRSKSSASVVTNRGRGRRVEGQTFHDNCKCTVEPLYETEQYDEDDRFDLNRELQAEWPRRTGGSSGKAALTKWRRYIRQRNAA